jgi:hypothetical protein
MVTRRRLGPTLVVFIVLATAVVATSGCEQARAFLPRTHTRSVSPDGRHTAIVRQGLNNDPPDDHLFLVTNGRATRKLMDLAPDADWCHSIIWTPDSRLVGFVISDVRVAVFDAGTERLHAIVPLIDQGCCGGPQEARDVAFSADGTRISFERVERATVTVHSRSGRDFTAAVTSESPNVTSRWPLHTPARTYGREVVVIVPR